MQIGNRAALDAAREALRDAFDAVWIASPVMGDKEARAVRCAAALDKPRHGGGNWTLILDDSGNIVARITGAHNHVIYG